MTLSARVIGIDATPWFRTITVDRGLRDGVDDRTLAVIAPGGVVGRVGGRRPECGRRRVQLIIDRNAAAGATRRADARAGRGRGGRRRSCPCACSTCRTSRMCRWGTPSSRPGPTASIRTDSQLGTVTSVRARPRACTRRSDIEPAMEFDRLEHVLIVTHDERLAAAGRRPMSPAAGSTRIRGGGGDNGADVRWRGSVSGTVVNLDLPLVVVVLAALSRWTAGRAVDRNCDRARAGRAVGRHRRRERICASAWPASRWGWPGETTARDRPPGSGASFSAAATLAPRRVASSGPTCLDTPRRPRSAGGREVAAQTVANAVAARHRRSALPWDRCRAMAEIRAAARASGIHGPPNGWTEPVRTMMRHPAARSRDVLAGLVSCCRCFSMPPR